ncbi:MgtC/SapB family protein [Halanaerobium sp. Z-7514]|uniref:MgtC/SapB family protein n=1 Tax=Halanaerobium polyolivorans TaxID=2886943 RepID=A0AAW4WV38_9FIRM|nr:MgtC/SapB family protein [Halanaerobium polyolivorans]MCC3144973.1 MgtC/SapB family protein [Halanaerobium polyolivorans]
MLEYTMRIILSGLIGGVVGYERQTRDKAAGMRTNILVAVTSCLIMISSYRLAIDLGPTDAYADAARIVAQVVSGVGFIGAGTIIKHKDKVKGLTTAAGLWAVSGLGIAVGQGYYFIAIVATLVILSTLALSSFFH